MYLPTDKMQPLLHQKGKLQNFTDTHLAHTRMHEHEHALTHTQLKLLDLFCVSLQPW